MRRDVKGACTWLDYTNWLFGDFSLIDHSKHLAKWRALNTNFESLGYDKLVKFELFEVRSGLSCFDNDHGEKVKDIINGQERKSQRQWTRTRLYLSNNKRLTDRYFILGCPIPKMQCLKKNQNTDGDSAEVEAMVSSWAAFFVEILLVSYNIAPSIVWWSISVDKLIDWYMVYLFQN